MYLALHSYGEKIIYPWSYTSKKVGDWKDLDRVGRVMSRAMKISSHGKYKYRVRYAKYTTFLHILGNILLCLGPKVETCPFHLARINFRWDPRHILTILLPEDQTIGHEET